MSDTSQRPGASVVFSAVTLGLRALDALDRSGVPVVGLVSVDDTYRSASGMEPHYFGDFGTWSVAHSVPYLETGDLRRGDVMDWVAARAPDWILSIGWPLFVPGPLRAVARHGTLGTHASLLPARRGSAPLNWALIDGLARSGVSILELTHDVDAGPIVWQSSFGIGDDDDVADLLTAAGERLASGFEEIASQLVSGRVDSRAQDDRLATWTRRRRPEDGRIDWKQTSSQIHNLVRGLTSPFPGAWTTIGSTRLRILRTRKTTGVRPQRADPGVLMNADGELTAITGDYMLALETVDAGSGPEPALAWAEQAGVTVGATPARLT